MKKNGSWGIYYICRDYLGSITHITNSAGVVQQELSYDAWGRLRNPINHVLYAPGLDRHCFYAGDIRGWNICLFLAWLYECAFI